MRILLDANVLLRLSDTDHVAHETTEQALAWLEAHRVEGVLVPQVFYEYWAVATRPTENNGLGRDVTMVAADLADYATLYRMLLDERGVYVRWQGLVTLHQVKGKLAHDARLVAAMQRHGITHLLTFNKADFQRYPGISVFSPDEVLAGLLPA